MHNYFNGIRQLSVDYTMFENVINTFWCYVFFFWFYMQNVDRLFYALSKNVSPKRMHTKLKMKATESFMVEAIERGDYYLKAFYFGQSILFPN